MRSQRFFSVLALAAVTPFAVLAACGGGDAGGPGSTGATMSGSGGADGGKTTSNTGSGGSIFTTSTNGGQCATAADCDGGVCVDGMCCDSAANVCANTCCSGGTVCLFDECVMPGNACHTAADCPSGEYCETALGDADGGTSDAGTGGSSNDGGPLCLQPLPLGGKCLPLPAVCGDDAGTDAGDCVAKCEYHPPVGQLNAVPKWTWGPVAQSFPDYTDVWSTPTVGRVYDSNCDGKIDELDAPVVVVVTGDDLLNNPAGTNCQSIAMPNGLDMCQTGVLRMLDGNSGKEIWSLNAGGPNSAGFAGMSVALGDIDGDGKMDIVAVNAEGYVVLLDSFGNILRTSDKPIPVHTNSDFGWGGGLAIADMDGDGFPEIAYGATVFTTKNNAITLAWTGTKGTAGTDYEGLSTFVDLDGDGTLELLAGKTAYKADGTVLWNSSVADGFPGVGDFDLDGLPDVAHVANGSLWILDGATGAIKLGPVALPGTGSGGPPTVADFDGDGKPEIGVAMATFYSVMKPNFATHTIDVLWSTPNHDLSSSVTGSSVFDFEGDGKAEVIYADECFLWVFDGTTGAVRFAAPHTSFTGTEASLVADVDGDGHSEIVMITNGADPSKAGWGCLDASGNPSVVNGVTWTPSTLPNKSYRGLTVFGDAASSWVGTRTLWNEHTYHVSNICDDRDTACDAPNVYGSIPKHEKSNWTLPWLNNFRQNVQDKGIFDAPDATVSIKVTCTEPIPVEISVRNIGLAVLPAGVNVALFKTTSTGDVQVATVTTTHPLFPGQTEEIDVSLTSAMASKTDAFHATIVNDPNMPTFHECREDNDDSGPVKASCVQ